MSNRIVEDLRTYVKSWNNATQNRLTFYSDTASIYTDKGEKIFQLNNELSKTSLLSALDSSDFGAKESHRFLADLANISWSWNPTGLRSRIFSPALQDYRARFPRVGYAHQDMPHLGVLEWKRSSAECEQALSALPGRGTYVIYNQSDPDNIPVPIGTFGSRLYDLPPSPIFRPSPSPLSPPILNLDGVVDTEVDENGLSCSVCMANKPCIAAGCGHLTVCGECARRIGKSKNPRCPNCRGAWVGLRRIFL
jgi:hypothetical protein